jgi:phage terminase large subunit-like protein
MTHIPEWSTACLDWRDRIIAGKSLIPFAPLFPAEASAAMEAFNALKIVDAPGSPVIGESSREWVQDFASAIFGAYDHETGRRLIREFFMLISKKNSKSTTAAGIMLTALLRNWRKSAEFLIVAPTLEVANNSYYPARDMVKADDELSDLLHVQDHLKTITHRGTGATLKVVAADNDTVSGKKATGVLIDELWLFGKRANAENMLREATGGLVSRPEGFVVYLSTQSDEPPSGIFRQKLNYYRDVRDGKITDKRSLPVIYEFPEEMVSNKSYLETEYLHVTNPNIGLSVDREWLVDELGKAQNAGEESLRGFLAKHLNVEIGMSLRSDRWAGADFWEDAAEEGLTLDGLIARSEVAVVGVDGGGLDDLFGLAVIGREKGSKRWLCWTHSFCHRSVLEKRKAIAAQMNDFAKAGDLTIINDLGDDIAAVVAHVQRLEDAGILAGNASVGLDPYGVGSVIDALAEAGIGDERVVAVSQGYKLQGAIKTTERKLADGTMKHGGQDLMAWCVGNAKIELKGNAAMITKQASGVAKIDPLMALFDAAALMSMNPEPRSRPTIFDYSELWGVA